MNTPRIWTTTVFISILSAAISGCAGSNSTTTQTGAYPRVLERAKKNARSIILHSGVDSFAVTSVVVERSKRQFTVQLGKLDSSYQATLTGPSSGREPLRLYMLDSTSYTLDEPHTIPITKIGRIEGGR
ncbi:hypothetical protein SAMN05444008_105267 [Cnuella takakiae]|uniref:Uncharacterized protein n=1 Tax=Cnuella takakiae TaxID=1302690 RepID=A0A1M4ZLZ2_9BACT|nr:hypothetical protein [Cnuella takakiae]OLY94171.1 hypothetical protein BUE76_21490 [Cnuella takakiae]SHF18822.1 hypothetical protein SAMN05444008_105267 [Cnuella takakiae]